MKSPGLVLAFLLLNTLGVGAQVAEVSAKPLSDDDIKLIRSNIQDARESVIRDTMQFSDAEAKAFWPIYNDYAAKQRAIADKRKGIILDYAKQVDTMTDAQASDLTDRMLQVEDETQALRRKFLPKFQAALGARRAAKFYQVDNRLAMILNVQLASEIPLIP